MVDIAAGGPSPRLRALDRRTALDVPVTVLACLAAVMALGLSRPAGMIDGLGSDESTITIAGPAVAGVPTVAPPAGRPIVPRPGPLPAPVSVTASQGRTVALTFDDGPDPRWTPAVLELLRRYDAKATFCIVGSAAEAHPGLVAQIRREGHLLCDHTQTHDAQLAGAPRMKVRTEVLGARDRIVEAGGPGATVPYFRAPEGAWSPALLSAVAEGGMTPLSWSVDTLDWTRPGVDAVMAAVRSELEPGGVILLHDGGGPRAQTVQALAMLLPYLRSQGYTIDSPATTFVPQGH